MHTSTSNFFKAPYVSDRQLVSLKPYVDSTIRLDILREDRIHPIISGNKFRKLKYNLQYVLQKKLEGLITFGGAYSNHIAATAAAGQLMKIKTIGIIRGAELKDSYATNPTLKFASQCGMKLHFVDRAAYKLKETPQLFDDLAVSPKKYHVLPEGGTNELAIKGCEEILQPQDAQYDYICASVGTGGTIAGLINAALPHQQLIGFSALKGNFQKKTIEEFSEKNNYTITDAYSFGGYAKIDRELIRFMNEFKKNTGIRLDPIYTAKMMYGIIDQIKNGLFSENSCILAVHTGGLQGIAGMNTVLKNKNLPQIES